MKNLLRFILIGIVLFSYSSNVTSQGSINNLDAPPEKEVYFVELFFESISLNDYTNCKDAFDSEACQMAAIELKNSIIEKIRKIDSTIVVDTMHVRVYLDVSVYLDSLNKGQFKKLEAAASANNYVVSQTFEIQARRPIMQTDYIEQARRPIMQEQLRYDKTLKTSKMILEVGGGRTILPVPNHRIWIVDSGIDSAHQDLNFRPTEKTLSQDFSIGKGNNPFEDSYGHGTFLAGVIGGQESTDPIYKQGYGVNGVFPGARMISIKVFDGKGKSNNGKIKSALEYVLINTKAGDVVNLSWGLTMTPPDCKANNLKKIYECIDKLAVKGIYVVMSAGNEAQESSTNFPGCIDLTTSPSSVKDKIFTIGSIEVTNPDSTSRDYLYSIFSNYGRPSIDYLTPGEDVFTTAPHGQYVLVSGTSISAAMFSGILYHNVNVDTLKLIKRGAAQGDPDPDYPIAKVRR